MLARKAGAEVEQSIPPTLRSASHAAKPTRLPPVCLAQAAQHGAKRVVVVVGRGHVKGLVFCLLEPWRVRQRKLAWMQENAQGGRPKAPPLPGC